MTPVFSPVVPACGWCMRWLPEQVHSPGELHWDPESCWKPRPDDSEDRGSGLHHHSVLPAGPAAGLPGAAGRVTGGRPAEGWPRCQVWGECVWGTHALGEGPAGRTLSSTGQVAFTCATATVGTCVLCGKSGVGWTDSTMQRGFSFAARGPHISPLWQWGQYAGKTKDVLSHLTLGKLIYNILAHYFGSTSLSIHGRRYRLSFKGSRSWKLMKKYPITPTLV